MRQFAPPDAQGLTFARSSSEIYQLFQLIETQKAEDVNHRLAQNIGNRVGDFRIQVRDLNIQLEDVKNQMYTIKSERNQLMIENHNLREENKDLAQQLTAVDGKCTF